MKLYSDDLVKALQSEADVITGPFGVEILVKKIPDEPRPGLFDPREKAIMDAQDHSWTNMPKFDSPSEMAEFLRSGMGFPNRNINTVEIHTKFEELNLGGNTVGLWRYYPRKSPSENRPCFVYIHGGGFIGGSVYTVENFCRFIAEKANAVVFNVDYSLAPEKPFPNGFNDCYLAVRHVYENAGFYGIDKNRIGVGGDSAGGNLTAAIALRARDVGLPMVALQVPIYPVVTSADSGAKGYKFSEDEYDMSPEHADQIKASLGLGRSTSGPSLFEQFYDPELAHQDSPYIHPLLADSHKDLPRALIAVAEFDGLRIQGELYGGVLKDAGVPVKVIRHKGVGHAYIDRIGFVPQAEDLALDIAAELLSL